MSLALENSLLEKTRRLNQLLHRSAGTQVDFNEMAEVLAEVIDANVYVFSRKGKVLGHASSAGDWNLTGAVLSEGTNRKFFRIDETTATAELGAFTLNLAEEGGEHQVRENAVTVVPVSGGGDRLGTLVIGHGGNALGDEELLVAELGSAVFGMAIYRAHATKREDEARERATAHVAIASLSYSEQAAIQHIFSELRGKNKGLLVASKIADRAGITRSVIVNALRKFESAGVIETRSLGMKGTHISVKNHLLAAEVAKRA